MWSALAVLAAVAGVGALGVVCYRAGYNAAENKALQIREAENAKVDKIIANCAELDRCDLIERLRGNPK